MDNFIAIKKAMTMKKLSRKEVDIVKKNSKEFLSKQRLRFRAMEADTMAIILDTFQADMTIRKLRIFHVYMTKSRSPPSELQFQCFKIIYRLKYF